MSYTTEQVVGEGESWLNFVIDGVIAASIHYYPATHSLTLPQRTMEIQIPKTVLPRWLVEMREFLRSLENKIGSINHLPVGNFNINWEINKNEKTIELSFTLAGTENKAEWSGSDIAIKPRGDIAMNATQYRFFINLYEQFVENIALVETP